MVEAPSTHQPELTPATPGHALDWDAFTAGPEAHTESRGESPAEGVGSINVTTDMLITALDLQAKLSRQRILAEQDKRQQEATDLFEKASDDLRRQATERPGYFRSDVLNRHNKARKNLEAKESAAQRAELNRQRASIGLPPIPEPAPAPREHPHQKYARHGKSRWGVAALEGVPMAPGMGGPLEPMKRGERIKALRAARRATTNLSIVSAKEMLERDPRLLDPENKDRDRGGQRHGGAAINPDTGRSRYRDEDPKLKNRHRQDRKMIKAAEKSHKKLAKKHRDDVHYLTHQGDNFIVRHNIAERTGDKLRPVVRGIGKTARTIKRTAYATGRAAQQTANMASRTTSKAAEYTGRVTRYTIKKGREHAVATRNAYHEGLGMSPDEEVGKVQRGINRTARKAGRGYVKAGRAGTAYGWAAKQAVSYELDRLKEKRAAKKSASE